MNISRLMGPFLLVILIAPIACLAQSDSTQRMTAPTGPRNDYVVSVQELRMSNKARKTFDQGAHLLQKGNAAASVPYFERAIAEFPEHYRAYYDLGVAHIRLGHTAEAQQAFQKSIDLTGGGYAPPQFAMGMVLCQEQELENAERVIQRGLDLEPGSATGKYFLGWAQFGLNHLVEAERSVRQALLRKANFAEAYFLLARIHQRQHNAPAEVKDLEAYLKLDPHSAGSQQARASLERARQAMNERTELTLAGR